MAISNDQKVDWLWKKVGYGAAKTDVNSIKAAVNEAIPSALLLRGENVWTQSDIIPAQKPTSSTTIVTIYDDTGNGQASVECTPDTTASQNRTWKTGLTDWISAEFGATYQVKVYMDTAGSTTPESTGTQLFAAGSGNNDEWFFDYQAGVLNFIGDNLPSGISGQSIFIVGARYAGLRGANFSSLTTGNFTFTGNTMSTSNTNGAIILDPNGTGRVILSADVKVDSTGAITIPVGTTTERPSTLEQGMIRYNTTDSTFEGYDGTNWGSLGGVKDVDQDTYIVAETSAGADGDDLDFYTAGTHRLQINQDGNFLYGGASLDKFTIDYLTGNTTIAGTLTISGNLQVDGTTTTVNSNVVTIDDPIFTLGGDAAPTSDDNKDRGIEFQWYDGEDASPSAKVGFFGFDDSARKFTFIPDATNASEVFSGTAGDVAFGDADLASLTVTGNTSLLGDITLGDTDADTISINGEIRTNVVPDAGDSYDLGTASKSWRDLYLSESVTFAGLTGENAITVPSNMQSALIFNDGVTTFIDIDTTTGAFAVDISAATTINDTLNVTGESTLASATISDVTATHIMYAGTSGSVDGDANLVWDGTQLAVGVTNFTVQHATGNTFIAGTLETDGEATLASAVVEDLTDNRIVIAGTSGALEDDANFRFDGTNLQIGASGSETFDVAVATGNTQIAGTLDVDGQATLASANVEDLTDNEIVLAGTNGELEGDTNFRFDGTNFDIGASGSETFQVVVASGNTTIGGDATVSGNLTVDGTVGTLNVTTLTIDDPIVTIAGDQTPTADDNKDRGIEFKWHDGVDAKLGFFGYDDSASVFTFVPDATNTSEVISGTAGNVAFGDATLTGATVGNIQIGITDDNEIDTSSGNLTIDSADGTVTIDDNAVVTGTLDVTGVSNFNNTTTSTSTTTGAVIVDGGVGIAENLHVGGTLNVTGESTLASATVSDLTDNRIVIAGTNGSLEDDANFRFDGANFQIGPSGNAVFDVAVATGNTQISGNLTLGGNITIGDADTDSISIGGEFTSDLIPDVTDTYSLGSATKAWKELFLSETLQFTGATGENNIFIPANVAEALSISDGSTDLINFNTTTGVLSVDVSALKIGTAAGTTTVDRILDEDNMASNSDVALATQQSIKTYVDTQDNAQALSTSGDTGTGSVLINTQVLAVNGTANEIETSVAAQAVTIGLPDDVTIGRNLTVTNAATTGTTMGVGTSLTVGTDASIGNDLTVTRNATVSNDLTVTNDASIGNDLTVGRDATITRNAVISGDLTVSGTTTYINTTELNIGDNIIVLNADLVNTAQPTQDAGISVNRGAQPAKDFIWDETNDRWTASGETIEAGQFEGTIDGGTF